LAICLVALVVILAVQNMEPVELQIYFWKLDISPIILIPITFLLGVFVGRHVRYFGGSPWHPR